MCIYTYWIHVPCGHKIYTGSLIICKETVARKPPPCKPLNAGENNIEQNFCCTNACCTRTSRGVRPE